MKHTNFSRDEFYTVADLTRVLRASYLTVTKAIEAGQIPYEESPLTSKKYFKKETIHELFKEKIYTTAV